MFTQAGFDTRATVILVAIVQRLDRPWRRPAYLHRWRASGELAWIGARGISWGEQLRIVPFFRIALPTIPKVSKVRQ